MRNNILLIPIFMLVLSCTSTEQKNEIKPVAKDSLRESQQELETPMSSLYDEELLEEIKKNIGAEKIVIKDHLIISNDTDTIFFPQEPALNSKTILQGEKNKLKIQVELLRDKYTSLSYLITFEEKDKKAEFKGRAKIGSGFFLGSEIDEDAVTEESYSADEYIDESNPECFLSIRVGRPDEKNGLVGKLIKKCNGEFSDIDLDNFPSLREKK